MPNCYQRDGFFYPTLTLMIDSYITHQRSQVKLSKLKCSSVYEDCFKLANSVDTDKIVAFNPDLYCFKKNQFSGFGLVCVIVAFPGHTHILSSIQDYK